MEKKWFVFYTKSRQEKKVNELLLKSGYEPYLPLQATLKQWSDRKKKVISPLFPSYIFVRAAHQQIAEILTVPGIAWNIRLNGEPATVRDGEISMIRRFLATGLFLEVGPAVAHPLNQGDRVKIIDGPLVGMTGTVSGTEKDLRFSIEIESIHQVIRVQIPAYLLQKA